MMLVRVAAERAGRTFYVTSAPIRLADDVDVCRTDQIVTFCASLHTESVSVRGDDVALLEVHRAVRIRFKLRPLLDGVAVTEPRLWVCDETRAAVHDDDIRQIGMSRPRHIPSRTG